MQALHLEMTRARDEMGFDSRSNIMGKTNFTVNELICSFTSATEFSSSEIKLVSSTCSLVMAIFLADFSMVTRASWSVLNTGYF